MADCFPCRDIPSLLFGQKVERAESQLSKRENEGLYSWFSFKTVKKSIDF
jgi:hypothetical protein